MDMFGGLGAYSPSSGPPEATPQQNPFAKQSTAPAPNAEDEDEWEYEYSTTETETYYVTLDLTNPRDPPKRKPAPHIGRISARIRWINPVLFIPDEEDTQKKKQKGGRKRKSNRKYRLGSQGLEDVEYGYEHGDDEDDISESENEGGSDSDGLDRMRRARARENEPEEENLEASAFRQDSEESISDPGDAEDEDDFNTVQISELHSKEPFVLFRGKYYKCQWHTNIGTELLFTKHDPDDPDPLPSLRTLSGDVDLLAASSARIMGKEVLLTPKDQKVEKPRRSRLKVKDLAIDVGKGASAKRKAQAKFLEEFINIKLEMGELDAVTVNAVSRKSIWKWNEYLKEENKNDIQQLKKVVAKGGKPAADAAKKIQEIEEEMERRQKAVDGGKKKGGPGAGKRKGVPGGKPKPKRGRPVTGKLQEVAPETPTPATPASGMGSMAASSRGDVDSDEMEDSEDNSEEGDGEEDGSGDEDSGQEDSGEERSDEGGSEEGDSEDEERSSGSDEDERSDEDDEGGDTTMYD
ncbi:hypothetical protein N431DRAFT_554586 [Stipitochalara longipes BDJ]|nr:hypothetical protein N431DRAFT_554586 [Stipitochalara longipes BDJ]